MLYVNFLAHRSFQDPSSYPVFPWVQADYKFTFDPDKPQTLRDLSKPVGVLSEMKHEQSRSKYFELINKQNPDRTANSAILGDKPYMFVSHYSMPGIVFYYLIR